jgi:ubiquinone/menaquinone biosynthesis C-methylase UbiE
MSTYNLNETLRYEKVIKQPVYRYYVEKKTKDIKKWINQESIILDIGCGTGVYTTNIAKNCKTIIGLDSSQKMIEQALLKTNRQGIQNAHFVIADAAYFPFKASIFDLIFSVNLIHHMVYENKILQSIYENRRCNKLSGLILIYDLNQQSLAWSMKIIPKLFRKILCLIFKRTHNQVIDNEEEGTKIINLDNIFEKTKSRIIFKKNSGFIPTFCPMQLFKVFIIIEKIMESIPIVRSYGAHTLIVGDPNEKD